MFPTNLDSYLQEFAPLLAQQAQQRSRPLHTPGKDAPVDLSHLLRKPLEAQQHVVTAICKAWAAGEKGLKLSAEMGTGKTFMGIAAADYAGRHEYRAIVMCPPHLCLKWEREIRITLPKVDVYQIRGYRDVANLNPAYKSLSPEWYVVSQTRAKLGTSWKPAYRKDAHDKGVKLGNLCCPDCHELIWTKNRAGIEEPTTVEELRKSKRFCESCGAALWQWTNEYDRWPVADYIHKKLNGYFDFAIVDECFPGETAVRVPGGEKRIDQIKVGDRVVSWDGKGWTIQKVSRTIRKRHTGTLVRILHDDRILRCTPNHNVWENVSQSFCRADSMKPGDALLCVKPNENADVPLLQTAIYSPYQEQCPILLEDLCMEDGRRCKADASQPHVRGVWDFLYGTPTGGAPFLFCQVLHGQQEVGEHSDVPDVREGVSFSKTFRVLLSSVLGDVVSQTADVSCVREDVLFSQATSEILLHEVRPALHCRNANGGETEAQTFLEAMQRGSSCPCQFSAVEVERGSHRPCTQEAQDCDRGRRRESLEADSDRPRQEEDGSIEVAWVDCASVLERAGTIADIQLREDCCSGYESEVESTTEEPFDGYVYNLEVETDHCYFANGVLVSNCHQAKSAESAIGNASGSLVASVSRALFLSGTVFGGYAWHTKAPLFRLTPATIVGEGFTWEGDTAWNETYGRIETKVVESEKKGGHRDYAGNWNTYSMGKTARKSKSVKPGVMPTLFGRHMIGNMVFLSLDEVAENLPVLDESVIAVEMDDEQRAAYCETEHALRDAIKSMLAKGDKRLLSRMLMTLLGYCDHPYGWGEIGYYERDDECGGGQKWMHVVTPQTLDAKVIRPKEQALIDFCLAEREEGRKVWVYSVMTDKRDVVGRVSDVLAKAGLRVATLRSSVETTKREAWMAEHCPHADCCVSHPQLVETGLDFFDFDKTYNVGSIWFHSTGYNCFTLRQAARRAWRIGQDQECRVRYAYYQDTMQARALTLMGKKLSASQSMEGKFSMEGLAALAGDEGTIETAMARSLVTSLGEDLDVGRAWRKVGQKREPKLNAVEKRFVAAMARTPGTKQLALF